MTALNSTVASKPAREHVLVLTDANARTGNRGKGGGEADIKVLGAYDRHVLNENGKLLLGFAEGNKLDLLSLLFCTLQRGVPYTFKSANCIRRQACLNYILTKQENRQMVRCVNARLPPFATLELDHNLVYTNPHSTQVRTKPKEEEEYQGNEEAGRPPEVDH